MSDLAKKTRTYLNDRIDFLQTQLDGMDSNDVSGATPTLIWETKAKIKELKEALVELNGGTSIFRKAKGGEVVLNET